MSVGWAASNSERRGTFNFFSKFNFPKSFTIHVSYARTSKSSQGKGRVQKLSPSLTPALIHVHSGITETN